MQRDNFSQNAAGRIVDLPAGQWTFVPDSLPPTLDWTDELVNALSMADRAVGKLAGLCHMLPLSEAWQNLFVRREVIHSCQIDGAMCSLNDLLAYEAGQMTAFDLPTDVRVVASYVGVLHDGIQQLREQPLVLAFIQALHRESMASIGDERPFSDPTRHPQRWMTETEMTATSHYVPLPTEAMAAALNELERFIHTASPLPALIRLALIHYQWMAIQPFGEASGRIGRFLTTFLLQTWNVLPQPCLYLSAHFNKTRRAYDNLLLDVGQNSAWTAWLVYFLDGVRTQAADSVTRIQQLRHLQTAYYQRFQTTRSAARMSQVVNALFVQPLFTVQQLGEQIWVNYPTAQRYIDLLLREEIVREVTGKARNRVFAAEEVLRTIV